MCLSPIQILQVVMRARIEKTFDRLEQQSHGTVTNPAFLDATGSAFQWYSLPYWDRFLEATYGVQSPLKRPAAQKPYWCWTYIYFFFFVRSNLLPEMWLAAFHFWFLNRLFCEFWRVWPSVVWRKVRNLYKVFPLVISLTASNILGTKTFLCDK